MRRIFYVAFGATVGVLVVRRLTRAAESFTPEGLARNLGGAGDRVSGAVSAFLEDVRAGMVEREAELREALGLTGDEVAY
jgi:hypothetical protein